MNVQSYAEVRAARVPRSRAGRWARVGVLAGALQAPLAFAALFAGAYAMLVAFITADDLGAAGALVVICFAGWVFASALGEAAQAGGE